MAEVIKYGLIGDTVLLSLLEVGCARTPARRGRRPWSCSRSSNAARWQSVAWSSPTNGTPTASGWHSTWAHGQQCIGSSNWVPDPPRRGGGLWPWAALDIGVSLASRRLPREPRDAADASVRPWPGRLDGYNAEVLGYVESDKKRAGRKRWVLVATDGVTIRDDVPAASVNIAVTAALAGQPM